MASTIASTVIFKGSKWYIVKCDIVGGGGDLTTQLVNAVTGDLGLNPNIYEIHANFQGFSAQLLWKATTNVFAFEIPSQVAVHEKMYKQGGIPDNGGAGKNGDILISTLGLTTGAGSFTLKIRLS